MASGRGRRRLRADTWAMMDEKPLIRLNLRSYELYLREPRERRIKIELNASAAASALPQADRTPGSLAVAAAGEEWAAGRWRRVRAPASVTCEPAG